MTVQKVVQTIQSFYTKQHGPFFNDDDMKALADATGPNVGKQEQAQIANFLRDVLQPGPNSQAPVPVGNAEKLANEWLRAHPSPRAGALQSPGNLQTQIMMGASQNAAIATETRMEAFGVGAGVAVGTGVSGAAIGAGIGFVVGWLGGPIGAAGGAWAGAALGTAIGTFFTGPAAAGWYTLHKADEVMRSTQGDGSLDPADND